MVLREAAFQLKLAEELKGFGHKVYLHDAGTRSWPHRFSTDGLKPDLVVETSPQWAHHETIPVLAIEAKMGRDDNITDLHDGVEKMMALKTHPAQYKTDGKPVTPVLFLFTNPCLLKWDVATFWQSGNRREDNCCANYANKVLSVLLSRYTSAFLGKDYQFPYSGHVNGKQYARTLSLNPAVRNYP